MAQSRVRADGPLARRKAFSVSTRSLLVLIRRSLREELAEWPRLINDAGDRGPSKKPAAVGENFRKSIADWMHPIRVEKRWGGGTIRQGEAATGRPRLRRELFFEPSICDVQHLPGIGDASGVALGLRFPSIRDQRLHRTHDVVVKKPIHEPHRQGRVVVHRYHSRRSSITTHQVFHDDAGFDDRCVAVPENRKLLDWPKRLKFGPSCRVLDQSIGKRGCILVQSDQWFPTIGGERVSIESQRHTGSLRKPLGIKNWSTSKLGRLNAGVLWSSRQRECSNWPAVDVSGTLYTSREH